MKGAITFLAVFFLAIGGVKLIMALIAIRRDGDA